MKAFPQPYDHWRGGPQGGAGGFGGPGAGTGGGGGGMGGGEKKVNFFYHSSFSLTFSNSINPEFNEKLCSDHFVRRLSIQPDSG